MYFVYLFSWTITLATFNPYSRLLMKNKKVNWAIFLHTTSVFQRENIKKISNRVDYLLHTRKIYSEIFWFSSIKCYFSISTVWEQLFATKMRAFHRVLLSLGLFYRVVLTRIYRYSASSSTRDMDPPLSHCEKISNRPRQRPFHTRLHNGCLHSTECGVYKAAIYVYMYIPIWRETAFMQTVESYRVEAYVLWSRNRNSEEYVYVYSATL